MVEWDSWLPAGKWGKWGLVETEEDTMAIQAIPDVPLDEIEDDQVEEDDALAIPGTPVDDIEIGLDIDEVKIDEIKEDQVEEEYEMAIPGTPADGIDIDNMTTDEIEKVARRWRKRRRGKSLLRLRTTTTTTTTSTESSGSICPSLVPLSHTHTLTPPPS